MKQPDVFICDVKGCENRAVYKGIQIQTIFHTDQTEGKTVVPYLSIEKIDLCIFCYDKILVGNYLHGNGAQGNNEYYFKK